MKLTRIAGNEPTAKFSFGFKQSTADLLKKYQKLYTQVTGDAEIALKDVVEQMLLDFMADDKAFQKFLKQEQDAAAAPSAPAPAPALGQARDPMGNSAGL